MAGRVDADVGKPLVLWSKDDSQAVADAMKARIVDRTARGINAAGQPLAVYTSGKRKGQTVTLKRSGKMLGGIVARGTPKRASLKTAENNSSGYPYAHVQDRKHNWFGLTAEEWREMAEGLIAELVQAHVTASLPKEPTHGE